jgi:inorganic pyrophosphatase/exopolyphosphatase
MRGRYLFAVGDDEQSAALLHSVPTNSVVTVDSDKVMNAALHHRMKDFHTQIARGRTALPVGVKATVFAIYRHRHQDDDAPECHGLSAVATSSSTPMAPVMIVRGGIKVSGISDAAPAARSGI